MLCPRADTGCLSLSGQLTVTCLVDPGAFRGLHTFVQSSCDGKGRMEVVSLAATEEAPAHESVPVVSRAEDPSSTTVNPARWDASLSCHASVSCGHCSTSHAQSQYMENLLLRHDCWIISATTQQP